jgi:hypothetical protein
LWYVHEEYPNQLDQNEIIEIWDQATKMVTEWDAAMVNAKIDIIEMSYEEYAPYLNVFRTWRRSGALTVQVRRQYQ